MRLNNTEFIILQWIGSQTRRRLTATSNKPYGFNERTFYSLIDLGLIAYNPRLGKAWLTTIGRKFYNKYVLPVSERRKEEIKAAFADIVGDYSDLTDDGRQEDLENEGDLYGYEEDEDEDGDFYGEEEETEYDTEEDTDTEEYFDSDETDDE